MNIRDRLPDWAIRALRTAAQAAVAALLVALPAGLPDDPGSALVTAVSVAAWAGLVGAISAVHNVLEDKGKVPDLKHPKLPLLHEHGDVLHGHPNDDPDHTH